MMAPPQQARCQWRARTSEDQIGPPPQPRSAPARVGGRCFPGTAKVNRPDSRQPLDLDRPCAGSVDARPPHAFSAHIQRRWWPAVDATAASIGTVNQEVRRGRSGSPLERVTKAPDARLAQNRTRLHGEHQSGAIPLPREGRRRTRVEDQKRIVVALTPQKDRISIGGCAADERIRAVRSFVEGLNDIEEVSHSRSTGGRMRTCHLRSPCRTAFSGHNWRSS